jgi:uncharacterized protein with NRDE domain
MCLAVVALDAHPRYALVVAANRDEYHARPTAPAAWWREGVFAGRDLQAGGTWLGVTRRGRFALLTNVRDPARNDPSAPSRGELVPLVLSAEVRVIDALDRARADGARHNGFNLVAGEGSEAGWTSNRAADVRVLAPGIYGLSNASLDVAWPKVERTRKAVAGWIAAGECTLDPLFAALGDRTLATDAELPSTGVTLEWERLLSAPFITSARYGTRSSTVLAIERDGAARFVERSFAPDGSMTGEVDERFALEA